MLITLLIALTVMVAIQTAISVYRAITERRINRDLLATTQKSTDEYVAYMKRLQNQDAA